MNNYIHKGWSLTLVPPYSGVGGGGMKSGNVFGVAAGTFTIGVASVSYTHLDVYKRQAR